MTWFLVCDMGDHTLKEISFYQTFCRHGRVESTMQNTKEVSPHIRLKNSRVIVGMVEMKSHQTWSNGLCIEAY